MSQQELLYRSWITIGDVLINEAIMPLIDGCLITLDANDEGLLIFGSPPQSRAPHPRVLFWHTPLLNT